MNILVVHEVSYRKKVVYEYQDFAERLASMGHKVTVIDYDDAGDGLHAKTKISRTGLAEVLLENTPFTNLPIVKYITGRLNYKKILKEKLSQGEVDVVFLYSVFINGTNTIRLCKKHKVPVVYRVLDVYHKLRQSKLIELPLYLGEKFIYRNADMICLTNERMEGYIQRMVGPAHRPALSVIRHGVDTDHFAPKPKSAAICARYGISSDDKVALYLGTTYTFSGLDLLAENIHRLRAKCPTAKIMIVGGGEIDERLKQIVKEHSLEAEVILTGFMSYEDLPDLLSVADVCLNPFQLNEITRDIVPIKILQYLACGLPVLSTPLPDVVRLFPERKSGIIYESIDDLDKFIDVLADMLNNRSLNDELRKNGLEFIRENFSVTRQIAKLQDLLQSLVRLDRRSYVSKKEAQDGAVAL